MSKLLKTKQPDYGCKSVNQGEQDANVQPVRTVRLHFFQSLMLSGFTVALLAGFAIKNVNEVNAQTSKQVMGECKKKYGKSVVSWHRNKKGQVICVQRIAKKMQ